MKDYKILIDHDSELYKLVSKYYILKNTFKFRKKSKEKRDNEAHDTIMKAHEIVKNTIAKDFGWNNWNICPTRSFLMGELYTHKISFYVREESSKKVEENE